MTRVSLKEAYDNKDVVAQIYAVRDIAEGAEDNANSALSTANTASEHVDALVPQVEGAVQNANNASASAQASAQTVAGYENRLSTVEGNLGDVTLRVTTAEGNIVTIQGRVTALETADGQNVKITGEHSIGNYAVLLTGNQTKSGNLTLLDQFISSRAQNHPHITMINTEIPSATSTDNKWSYPIIFRAKDSSELGHLTFGRTTAGKSYLTLSLIDANNVTKTITLGVND